MTAVTDATHVSFVYDEFVYDFIQYKRDKKGGHLFFDEKGKQLNNQQIKDLLAELLWHTADQVVQDKYDPDAEYEDDKPTVIKPAPEPAKINDKPSIHLIAKGTAPIIETWDENFAKSEVPYTKAALKNALKGTKKLTVWYDFERLHPEVAKSFEKYHIPVTKTAISKVFNLEGRVK